MSAKDWTLLLILILCNGVVVFLMQKMFEKRQLSLTEKYKYISVLQQKVDNALALFMKALRAIGNDSDQIYWLDQFICGYCDVFYYYQQNRTLLKPLRSCMEELCSIHEQIKNLKSGVNDVKHGCEFSHQMESHFLKIYELL